MKIFSTAIIFALSITLLNAQTFEWVKTVGSINNEYGRSIAMDHQGNVYTTGEFSGTVDFDPGPAVTNLTVVGGRDFYISKLSPLGNLVWVKSIGGTAIDHCSDIAVDHLGNVYLTGEFNGTVDFDPGPSTFNLTVSGFSNAFVCKLDASGNFVWAKQFTATLYSYGLSIVVDTAQNVYTTGGYNGTMDLDPGSSTLNVSSAGSVDIFLSKLNSSGNLVWGKSIGGTASDNALSIALDRAGNVYTTGYFLGTCDFDPGTGVSNLTSLGSQDAFVYKLNGAGNFVWVKQLGGPGMDVAQSISLDSLGNIYTCGYFQGTSDFNPGAATNNLTAVGGSDIYISKLDNSGNYIWAKSMGGTSSDFPYSIATDAAGDVYTTGTFYTTTDFDPGPNNYNLTSNGNADIFISKLSSTGNFAWARNLGGSGNDNGLALAVDTSKNVYITGFFQATANLNPGPDTTNIVAAGGDDLFVLKLFPCTNTSATDTQIACDSLTWIDGITYTANNSTAMFTLPNKAGCDSIVTLNLTLKNSSTGIDTKVACDTFTWIDNITYTSSTNSPTFRLTNSVGCDSVVTLNLIINNSDSTTDVQTSCGSFTWIDNNTYTISNTTATVTLTNAAGCDSVITLNLTINSPNTGTDIQMACDSFSWIDNNTYFNSTNTPTYILTNKNGCDSVVTLNLTLGHTSSSTDSVKACNSYKWIDGLTYTSSTNSATHVLTNGSGCDSIVSLNLIITTIDSTVNKVGGTLTANAFGVNYQWINCLDSTVFTGDTNQSFTPIVNGSYAVIISKNGCVDTSDCFVINDIGLNENNIMNEASVFPNPTTGFCTLDLGQYYSDVVITVKDLTGKTLEKRQSQSGRQFELQLPEVNGVYFLEVTLHEQVTRLKVTRH